jgi:hypothetical protein
MCFKEELAGQRINCIHCHEQTTIPTPMTYQMQPGDPAAPQPGGMDYSNLRQQGYYEREYSRPTSNEGGGVNSQVIGWLIFLLIFGVGNVILYSTTGMLIIPIRR